MPRQIPLTHYLLVELILVLTFEVSAPESILLFSTVPSSRNLGFLDSSASSISVTAAGQDLTIYQSPTLLSSTRRGGTTGAGMLVRVSLGINAQDQTLG